jgi:hypothetical protein
MGGKLKKNIGFSLLPFAFIFLFESGYSILDPIPDFLGYILLCAAIINVSDINSKMLEALSGFRKGILINALRILAVFLLEKYFVGEEKSVGVLLLAFVLTVAELIVIIPAFKHFFEALLHLGMMNNGAAIYSVKVKRKKAIDSQSGKVTVVETPQVKNVTEKLSAFTVAFLIIRHSAMLLPEFTSLINNSSYQFVVILRVLLLIAALPVGIVWLIKMICYALSIKKDSAFIEALSEKYRDKLSAEPGLFKGREIVFGIYILLISGLLFVDFYVENLNALPNLFMLAGIMIGAFFLRKHAKLWWGAALSAGIGVVVSLIAYFSTQSFFSDHQVSAIRKNPQAYQAFNKMLALTTVEAVISVICLILTVIFVWHIFKTNTNMSISDYAREKSESKKKFFLRAAIAIFLCSIGTGSKYYFLVSQLYLSTRKWFYVYSAMISTLLSAAAVIALIAFFSFVINEIKCRYRLD